MNIRRTILAGIVGGVVVDLFLFLIRAMPFPGAYQFIASIAVGPVAFTSSKYILLGLALHFFISTVFALAYAAVATRVAALLENPTLGGTVFGIAVMVVMQIVLALGHAGKPPSVTGIVLGLITHIVFFGIPVAWIIAQPQRRQTLAI